METINDNINNNLLIAINKKDEKSIKIILQTACNSEQKDRRGNTPLLLLCQTKSIGIEIFTMLLEYGCDINAVNNKKHTALMYLSSTDSNFERLKVLESYKPIDMTNSMGFGALDIAKNRGKKRTVKFLKEKGYMTKF